MWSSRNVFFSLELNSSVGAWLRLRQYPPWLLFLTTPLLTDCTLTTSLSTYWPCYPSPPPPPHTHTYLSVQCVHSRQTVILKAAFLFHMLQACRCEPPSFSRDVWSIMCLAYKLLAGHPPWKEYAHCGTLLYIVRHLHMCFSQAFSFVFRQNSFGSRTGAR